MATKQEMREAIFGKLKSMFIKGEKPPKDIQDKINSDPKLKALHAKAKKSAEKSHKDAEKMLKAMGID